ncbi:sugar ABC transporter permease [Treponema sp. TIM-1]|uniref:carbohydrate ABC transporter permease n=1 Tax=Treponema sp. TIM-1 TaxID=2898417 RepID=UPI00397F9A62
MFLYPLLLCFVNSFAKVSIILGSRTFIGLRNYSNLIKRADFILAVKVTIKYVVMLVPALMVIALWVANTVSRMKSKAAGISTTVIFLPFMVAMISAGIIWDWVLDPNFGIVNTLLRTLGLTQPPGWLRVSETALISAVIISIWIRCPFSIMILYGGMKNVSEELYEAAELDGINSFQRFFKLTLPLINPQVVLALTLDMIFAFRAFDQIYAVINGGAPAPAVRTVMVYLISNVFTENYGMASAITVLMLLSLFVISLLQQTLLKRVVEY